MPEKKKDEDAIWTEDEIKRYMLQVRREVIEFSLDMEKVLRKNDYKRGWEDLPIHALVHKIKQEFEEMQQEYIIFNSGTCQNKEERIQNIRNEAIDMANFCMFLCHNCARKGEER